jgi:hypothetical protein
MSSTKRGQMTAHPGREKHQKTATYAAHGTARRIRPWIAMAVAGAALVFAAARTPAEVLSGSAAASLAEGVGPGPAPGPDCEGQMKLPPGHPPVGEARPLPSGHPPIYRGPALPPGHPPVSMMPRLPAGHPPVDYSMNEATEFPPGFLTTL